MRHQPDAVERNRERVWARGAGEATGLHPKSRGDPHAYADTLPPDAPSEARLPGVTARKPTQIPLRGWKQILKRAWAESKADNMPIVAAGVAFFGFLAIFPALIALISVYGLVTSPADAAEHVRALTSGLPESAQSLIRDRLTAITTSAGEVLTLGLIISVLAALWSASGGVNNLIKAVNVAYDEAETRGFLKLRGLSLLLTLGAIVFVLLTFGLVAVVPLMLDALSLGVVTTVLVQILRWGLLLVAVAGSLTVLYRVAPNRSAPRLAWVGLGSIVVTVVWAVVCLFFSFYVDNFGSYNQTYGAIAGVAVLMLWLYLTCYLVLLGAEINAEAEHQSARDTTEGPPQPMGQRNAAMADELPDAPQSTDQS